MNFDNELKKAISVYGDSGIVGTPQREYTHTPVPSSVSSGNESTYNTIRRYRTISPLKKIADMDIFKKL